MEVLLFILKIILIVLGVMLGIILFLLGLVLFVPIHYEVSGEIQDEWKIDVKGTIRYLLSIFKLIFSYLNGQTDMQIYLFGRLKKPKASDDDLTLEVNKTDNEQMQDDSSEPENTVTVCEVRKDEACGADTDKHAVNKRTQEQTDDVSASEAEKEQEQSETKTQTEYASKKSKSKQDKQNKSKKEKRKFDVQFWKQEFTDEHNRYVVKKCLKELKYLLQHFRFRKIKTDLVFSTGDPARTGQVLGILCMIPMLYRYEVKLIPDFEAEDVYLKGTFCVAGKVRLIHVLVVVLRLIFDKEVRLVVAKFTKQFK